MSITHMQAFFEVNVESRNMLYIIALVGSEPPIFSGRTIPGSPNVVYVGDVVLNRWKLKGKASSTSRRRVKTSLISSSDLQDFLQVFKPHSIVEFQALRGTAFANAPVFLLQNVINPSAQDPELEEAQRHLEPLISIRDEALDITYLNIQGDLEAVITWMGKPIKISISEGEALEQAGSLIKDQRKWDKLITEYAAAELLNLKNGTWLDDGENELTSEEFIERITLTHIDLDSETFNFSFEDGDIFWGHNISVFGSFNAGPESANIEG